jgi:ribosome recycling factor
VKAIEKAISQANLGLTPIAEGVSIRISIPQPTEERRKELGKRAGEYAEKAKISIRKARQDAIDLIRKLEKAKTLSEDQSKKNQTETQKTTDEFIKKVEDKLKLKQQELMKI